MMLQLRNDHAGTDVPMLCSTVVPVSCVPLFMVKQCVSPPCFELQIHMTKRELVRKCALASWIRLYFGKSFLLFHGVTVCTKRMSWMHRNERMDA